MDLKTAIYGVGNILRRDDGIGVYLAREMAKKEIDFVDVFEIGTETPYLEIKSGYKNIVIVDGMKADLNPGNVIILKNFEFSDFFMFSSHEKNYLSEIFIKIYIYFDNVDIFLFGVEINEDDWGIGLSEPLLKEFNNLLLKLENFCFEISQKEMKDDILRVKKN